MNTESLWQLQTSLSRLDELIRAAVDRAQVAGHDPNDALRGLVISPDEIEQHLQHPPLASWWDDQGQMSLSMIVPADSPPDLPFLKLVEVFQLDALDAYIFLLCIAPELDRRYERVYAYLHDDVSQRIPTVNLMMNLLGGTIEQRYAVWEHLQPHMPLRRHRLIEVVADPSKSNAAGLTHVLKVDARMVGHLLGHPVPDERLKGTVQLYNPNQGIGSGSLDKRLLPIQAAFATNPMIYLRGHSGMGQLDAAAALCEAYQLPLVVVNAVGLRALQIPFEQAWRLALREAYLHDAALLIDPAEQLFEEDGQLDSQLWQALVAYNCRPVMLSAPNDWEPLEQQRSRRLLRVNFEVPHYPERLDTWREQAAQQGIPIGDDILEELASKFRFTRSQIARAVHTATDLAASRGTAVERRDLYTAVQTHANLKLGHMAKRIEPHFSWDSLVLPPDQIAQLKEIIERARYAHIVQEEWGFRQKISNVEGVSALFAGESGTGKTLAAQVIAHDLGLVLYKIDLSAVVSKYIGETEKNLNVIFSEAQSSNAILFFDEADALFGKRSEVKDARDRYANIEIAYLLQQIEDYDGIAILATNLRQNLDDAFTRRLDVLVDFPFPESEYRRKIWEMHFPPHAPLDPGIDLDVVAERYRLAGGNIRNAALAAAYLAAADGGVITLAHIRHAIRREHQKMGRLLDDH